MMSSLLLEKIQRICGGNRRNFGDFSICARAWEGSRLQWLCNNQVAVHLVIACTLPSSDVLLDVWFDFEVVAAHLPCRQNMLANDLSQTFCPLRPDPALTLLLWQLLFDHEGYTFHYK